jgi:predicted secreted hydrolase
MAGAVGRDRLAASGSPGAIDLTLSTDRPPVLHDGDGWIDLAVAGSTYYYSRTRMDALGTLTLPGEEPFAVTGKAWFDHQWGDFIAVGAGGWDWFSVQLDDGRDLTISVVRGPGDLVALTYGTLVEADGSYRGLKADEVEITVSPHATWRSPHSGALYPARWRVVLPSEGLDLDLLPTMADQELDTTASTGVTYWEGRVVVSGYSGQAFITGVGYVELTGYAR